MISRRRPDPVRGVQESTWQSRIGSAAALQRHMHSVMLRVAWVALCIGIPVLGLGLSFFSNLKFVGRFEGLTVLASTTGMVGVIVGGSILWTAKRFTWVQVVGQAAQALRPRLSGERARELGKALRSTSDFDDWSSRTGVRLAFTSVLPTGWNGNAQRAILHGQTARRFAVLTAIGWFGMFPGVLFAGGSGMAKPYDGGIRVVLSLIPIEVPGAFFLVCAVLFLLTDAAEYTAGYTTRFVGGRAPREIRTAVDLVDPKTGYLLRAAGEVGLTRDEYWQRLYLVQQLHPRAAPLRLTTAGRPGDRALQP